MKRPGKPWITNTDTLISKFPISALVLDGKECWVAEGLGGGVDNYYSDDSAKTFTSFRVESGRGLELMTEARNGKTIVGTTSPSGDPMTLKLWVNRRQQKSFSEDSETVKTTRSAASWLQQNFPNPFNNTTIINYQLPQQYVSAKIIITDKNGNVLKQINLLNKGKGSVLVDVFTLLPGAYQYSLIIDGRVIASKQMVLVK